MRETHPTASKSLLVFVAAHQDQHNYSVFDLWWQKIQPASSPTLLLHTSYVLHSTSLLLPSLSSIYCHSWKVHLSEDTQTHTNTYSHSCYICVHIITQSSQSHQETLISEAHHTQTIFYQINHLSNLVPRLSPESPPLKMAWEWDYLLRCHTYLYRSWDGTDMPIRTPKHCSNDLPQIWHTYSPWTFTWNSSFALPWDTMQLCKLPFLKVHLHFCFICICIKGGGSGAQVYKEVGLDSCVCKK